MEKLACYRCTGCCFFSYTASHLLFIQDPLCQIRLVIKIKSTGKSAELESIWKGPGCPKFATQANSCYGSIVLFFASFKGQGLKNQRIYKKNFSTKRTLLESFSLKTRWVSSCTECPEYGWLCLLPGSIRPKSPFSDVKDLLCPQAGLPIYRVYFPGLLSDPFRGSQRLCLPFRGDQKEFSHCIKEY